MNRRTFLKLSMLGTSQILLPGALNALEAPVTRRHPRHILLLFTDQQTAAAMSGAGNDGLRTPAMDRLLHTGMGFAQTYCTAPICSASRSTFLTGMMPHETGVVFNGNPLRSDLPNLGSAFRSAGFRTVWAGKWHLPKSYPVSRQAGNQRTVPGFELLPFHDMHSDADWSHGGVTDPPLIEAVNGFLEGPHPQPFLLAVSLHNPHDICYFGREAASLEQAGLTGELPPLPANHQRDPDEPEFIRDCRLRDHYGDEVRAASSWDEGMWRRYLHHYYRLTEQVDCQIGRLLDTLRKTGLDKETLILFTSDHGDGAAAHEWTAKLSLYEESVRIPMILSGAGIKSRGVRDDTHLVSGLDIVPTLCDYAGVAIPPGCRGRSLRQLAEGHAGPWRDQVVTELAVDPEHPSRQGRMVRTARFKYIRFSYGARPEQLFDLVDDPGETVNLAMQPTHQARLQEHRIRLMEWMRDTQDPFEGLIGSM